jgi:pilus assembly protein CpaE
MTSSVALHPEPAPIVACTVSRDVQNFGLLIEDMEAALGESWGDLSFEDARLFLDQPEAATLEFIAIALDDGDEGQLVEISALIVSAKAQDVHVILIAEDVSPIVLHQLLKQGAEEFVPYPLPDGALHDAIDRLREPESPQARELPAALKNQTKATNDCNGVVLPVQGMAGGTGATTLAVNLAWELVNSDKKNPPRVCILDFDLQFGSVATFLDLPRREAIFELLSDTESMDSDSFMQSLLNYNERLHVFTAPSEILPLDIVTSEDIGRILEAARVNFDYVVIDMPSTIVQWTETVLSAASVYFVTLELDMRSAQNTLRMIRALKAEDLPTEKLRFVLNRAPRRTDLQGKSRAKRLAESLGIDIELQLPDGGKQVSQSADHGLPLSQSSTKNPLRKEITKLALSVHQHNQIAANG